MTLDSFLVFTGYDGSTLLGETQSVATDPWLKGLDPSSLIPLQHWSLDVEQTLNIGSQSTGAGAGKITFNPFTITRKVDKASAPLLLRCASGTPFKWADLFERRPATGPDHAKKPGSTFLTFRFMLVAIKSISWSSAHQPPTETISFEYGGLAIRVAPQHGGPAAVSGWNVVRNVSIPPSQVATYVIE